MHSFCTKYYCVLCNFEEPEKCWWHHHRKGYAKETFKMYIKMYRTGLKRRFLIEHLPKYVGQAHGNGRLTGGKREVSKQFKGCTSKKSRTHYPSMNRQCLTGMLIFLSVPKTKNKYIENRTIIILMLKTKNKEKQKHHIACNSLRSWSISTVAKQK